METFTFLSALPALLGLAGFVLYQVLGTAEPGRKPGRTGNRPPETGGNRGNRDGETGGNRDGLNLHFFDVPKRGRS